MKRVELEWNKEGLKFSGGMPGGPAISIDGNAGTGPSPMNLLLLSLASCSAIDIVHILERMRQPLDALSMDVEADREEGEGARKWTRIHMRFYVKGEIPEAKVQRAVDLSVEKYCSAYKQLKDSAEVTTELILN